MAGLLIGFKEFHFNMNIWESPWVGTLYLEQFINDFMFWPLLTNTIKISLLKILFGFPAPIILALMLNELSNKHFKKTLQTISYLPYFISWVVVVEIFNKFVSPNNGIFNDIKVSLFGGEPIYFMGEVGWFYPIMLLSYIWKNVGWNSIIYLATIAGIDPQIYEAAYMDGAGRWRCMRHITLPGIIPTAGILFLLSMGGIMYAGYEQIILLRTPGNSGLADILDYQILQQGIRQGRFGYATVAGFFQSTIGLILVVISNTLAKKSSGISLW
jgi:ABC-type polysaccharide transport system, permease component